MKKELSSTERVTWRGLPKRAWFKRESYIFKGRPVKVELWHAGVDIIQIRTPHPAAEEGYFYDRVDMHVRAMCGYTYSFEFYLAATQYGRAQYRDSIKGDNLRCKRCDEELAKAPEDRLMNSWAVPPTRAGDDTLQPNGELWWPRDDQ